MFAALADVVAPLAPSHGQLVSAEKLDGGLFATTYRLTFTNGERIIAKMAPTAVDKLLRYEHGILATEERIYRLGENRPDLLMPQVLLSDFTREHIDTDVLVVSHLEGQSWHSLTELTSEQREQVQVRLGSYMTRLHAVGGEYFGYPASPALQASTWPEAYSIMLNAVLDDAVIWDVELPSNRLREAATEHSALLAAITMPALVHTDLWEGNVFLDPETLEITGIIDTERAIWGDPLWEFVGASQFGDNGPTEAIARGYREAGGHVGTSEPASEGVEAQADPTAGPTSADLRILLYRCYMYCLLLVEAYPRGYDAEETAKNHTFLMAKLDDALDQLLR